MLFSNSTLDVEYPPEELIFIGTAFLAISMLFFKIVALSRTSRELQFYVDKLKLINLDEEDA